jgi:CPA1 family monovalent cation:H+ antiporter
MLIAIVAVLIARAGATMGGLSLMNLLLPERVPVNYQLALVWGGLRGAVTVALALSLPVDLEYWWTIQSMAFGVVLFTLFVQAPTTPMLLRRAGLTA